MRFLPLLSLTIAAAALATGCSETAKLTIDEGSGANPQLPDPARRLLPTVKIAPAKGWATGGEPIAATGFKVSAFATGLDHPRWLYTLPNGDILVAETNAPPRPDDAKSVKGFVMKRVMTRAGAATPSADRITLLRDADGDGVAETKTAFLQGLHSPFGMALVEDRLYIANTDAVVAFPYQDRQTEISVTAIKLADLPGRPLNHHWTKNLIASADGSKLYASVGSNSNIAENGMDKEVSRR